MASASSVWKATAPSILKRRTDRSLYHSPASRVVSQKWAGSIRRMSAVTLSGARLIISGVSGGANHTQP